MDICLRLLLDGDLNWIGGKASSRELDAHIAFTQERRWQRDIELVKPREIVLRTSILDRNGDAANGGRHLPGSLESGTVQLQEHSVGGRAQIDGFG